ncbi:MAG: amino acid ABC transporter permease [Acidimicrobiales bacterium]
MDWLTAQTLGDLWSGLLVTVLLTAVTSVTSVAVGVAVGGTRMLAGKRTRALSVGFIEVFRNVPALIQVIFWAFAVPNLFPTELRPKLFFDNPVMDGLSAVTGLPLPYYAIAACLGLTLNTGAHIAEIFRGGVRAIPVRQFEAARLLGAGPWSLFRTVIAPSAIRTSFPALSTRLIHNMKNTALASFVAVPELFSEIQGSITKTFRATEYLLLACVMYLVLSALMTVGLAMVDRRLQRWRLGQG